MANPVAGGDLAAFVAAVDVGTLGGAAEALGLTQSAVTKRIQALEKRLGAMLLDRGRTGVTATAEGRVLYPEARQALASLAEAEQAVADRYATAERQLAIAASHTIGEFLLPGWLAAFRRVEPDARATVEVVNSPHVLEAVRAGEASVGFVEGLEPLDGLDTVAVHRDEIVAVSAPDHPWRHRSGLTAADLAGQSYLTREVGSGTRAVAAAALERAGRPLEPALEMSSTQSIKRALDGGGFSLLSRLAIAAELRAGTLQAHPVADLDLTRTLCAVRDPDAGHGHAAAAFWRWLEAGGHR